MPAYAAMLVVHWRVAVVPVVVKVGVLMTSTGFRVRVTEADLVGSWVEVAVMVSVPEAVAVAGAV